MTAIVTEDRFAGWLDPKETRPVALLSLLALCPAERMEIYPVSDRLNQAGSQGPELLERAIEPPKPS